MEIVSLQIGLPKEVEFQDRIVRTGFFKYPVEREVSVKELGIEGDGQADLRVHGGKDKAVYAFPFDAYAEWKVLRPNDQLEPGIFGENLTIMTLPENQISIGDTFRVGSCVLQVTQPRFPCFKLGIRFNDATAVKTFVKMNRPGVYYRVLQEGKIAKGDQLQLIDQEQEKVSVLEIFNFSSSDPNFEMIKRALSLKSLNSDWRTKFETLAAKKS